MEWQRVHNPVFYRRNGLLSILPAPDSAQTGKTDIVQYPIVIDVLGTISGNFPTSHEIYIIYYVAINVLHAKMVALTTGLADTVVALLNEVLFKKLTEGLFEDITEINLLGNNNNTLALKYLGTVEKLK